MFYEAVIDLRVRIPEAGKCFQNVGGMCRVVTLPTFLDRVLPPLPHHVNINRVVDTLHRTGKRSSPQKPITLRGHWKGFSVAPRQSKHSEETAFNSLQSVVDSIITASGWAGDGTQPGLHLEINVDPVAEPSERSADTLPDAGLFCGSSASWHSIVSTLR